MFHPLEEDLSALKDSEIEQKLQELNKKFYQAQRLGNPDLLTQLSTFITIYRNEMSRRYQDKFKKDIDNDLDQLINVN
jgi:hypothetical protein